MKLTASIKECPSPYIIYGSLLLLAAFPIIFFNKKTLFLLIHHTNHPWLDHFFSFLTRLGSGYMYLGFLCLLGFLRVKNRAIFIGGFSYVLIFLVVQYIKRVLFADQMRPCIALTEIPLRIIEGIQLESCFSFPSGHVATIVAITCVVSLHQPTPSYLSTFLLSVVAVTVAYSRIYLGHHFYEDVYAGACIGTFFTLLIHSLVIHWKGVGVEFLEGTFLEQLLCYFKQRFQ